MRAARALALASSDIGTVNRATLALWHLRQLLPRLLHADGGSPLDAELDQLVEELGSEHNYDSDEGSEDDKGDGMDLGYGMRVAAVVWDDDDATESEDSRKEEERKNGNSTTQITPATQVSVVYDKYRCVICLDASRSSLSIDPATGRLFLDLLYESVELYLRGLLRPMCIGNITFFPEIHLSVMAQGSRVESLCMLTQDFVVTPANVAVLLQLLRDRIHWLEDDWSSRVPENVQEDEKVGEPERSSLGWMLHNAMFALHSLPATAAPSVVLVSDGVLDFFRTSAYDSLLMQLRRHDMECHFVRVGGSCADPSSAFGFVPDPELLRFVADSTDGRLFDFMALQQACFSSTMEEDVPKQDKQLYDMTSFQKAYFVRYSSVHTIAEPVLRIEDWCVPSSDGSSLLPLRPYEMYREKVHEYRIQADVERIVEARVREGFRLHAIETQRDGEVELESMYHAPSTVADSDSGSEGGGESYRLHFVFLLEWKQNVWVEYVVSCNASDPLQTPNGQELTSSDLYVKMNILSNVAFLRAYEDTMYYRSQSQTPMTGAGTPLALRDFIGSIQNVDRVLLHLMTATASVNASVDASAQFSFASKTNASSTALSAQAQASHPVFNIIGELTPVVWHRWFFVERFELLAVANHASSVDAFYRPANDNEANRSNNFSSMSTTRATNANRRNGGQSLEAPFGIAQVMDMLTPVLSEWSSQTLSKDLYLKFLAPVNDRKVLRHDRSHSGSRRRPRRSASSGKLLEESSASTAPRDGVSKSSLCFIRVEVKNKTICAIHVAFFATGGAAREQEMEDLKEKLVVGINEAVAASSTVPDMDASPSKSVVQSDRLINRLLVTNYTLQQFDTTPSERQEQPVQAAVTEGAWCCGGSELQLRSIFGAYMWHSNWMWEVASVDSLVSAMRRLHESRLQSGFWILDWTMDEDSNGHARTRSVIFGRELLMEDQNGHLKTSLVQYALRRVSDTCLMTSFWMEPQHGFVKARLSPKADTSDSFHWGLRHVVGHDIPVDDMYRHDYHPDYPDAEACPSAADCNPEEAERRSMEKEDERLGGSCNMYLSENDLLRLIQSYLYRSDRHLLSCLYTFDCVMNLRERIELLSQLSKDIEGTVGASWKEEEEIAARNGLLLPPFSTARLLGTARRSTERFLMYLQHDSAEGEVGEKKEEQPMASPANLYLYSMLEKTLRGLSDCEVSWTDFDGNCVGDDPIVSDVIGDETQMHATSEMDSMPVWLKWHGLSPSLQSKRSSQTIHKGKCFAKLVDDDVVVLAFLPSLETLQTRKRPNEGPLESSSHLSSVMEQAKSTIGSQFLGDLHRNSRARSSSSRPGLRAGMSADDIVLLHEQRRSFREGYKSWRMGFHHGSRDQKDGSDYSSSLPFLSSSPGDTEFCHELSRQSPFGCDFHVLIEQQREAPRTGFFQVAFYECSASQLSSKTLEVADKENSNLPLKILQRLFLSPEEAEVGSQGTYKQHVRSKSLGWTHMQGTEVVSTDEEVSLSLTSRRFQRKVKRAHEHNFTRGVYVALREGGELQRSDLAQAISSCVEVPIDLDITLLYRMLQLDASNRTELSFVAASDRRALKKELSKSLEAIVAKIFHRVSDTNYFYFTGAETTTSQDEFSEDEYNLHLLLEDGSEDIESISQTNETFSDNSADELTEEVVKNQSRRLRSTQTMPVRRRLSRRSGGRHQEMADEPSTPSSDEALELLDHHPAVVEDAEFNKEVAVATSTFSAPFFFRFEYRERGSRRYRANEEGQRPHDLPRAKRTQSFNLGSAPVASSMSSGNDGLALRIKSDGKDVARIAEWFTKSPSSRTVLRLVTLTLPNEQLLERSHDYYLRRGAPFDRNDVYTNSEASKAELFASLPLFQRQVISKVRTEIKEWSSMQILSILRRANQITPSIARLVQKLFEDLPSSACSKAKYPLDFVPGTFEGFLDPIDLFRQELLKGTFLHVHENDGVLFVVHPTVDGAAADDSQPAFEVRFWAYLVLGTRDVTLHLHQAENDSTSVSRLETLTSLHMSIANVCKRVNQYLLLLQLHETRSCNSYLLPPDANQSSSPQSPERSESPDKLAHVHDDDGVSGPFFWPGQFACDRQYAAFFKLHERLAPNIALNMLCTSALEQFEVHNRRQTFVYRDRDGHVFYMKIRVASSLDDASTASSDMTGILLEVFGVCKAGEEITLELCRLLERKLDEATQLIMMKLLARNAKFQLTASDVAFVCPSSANPSKVYEYEIPIDATRASAFRYYLCQMLSIAPYIRHLTNATPAQRRASNAASEVNVKWKNWKESVEGRGDEPASSYVSSFDGRGDSMYGAMGELVGAAGGKVQDEVVDHASFVLNLNPELRLSPTFLSLVGKGLGLLHVDLLVRTGDAPADATKVDLSNLDDVLSSIRRLGGETETSQSTIIVRCELFVRGGINSDGLMDYLHTGVKETVVDYAIETTLEDNAKSPENSDSFEPLMGSQSFLPAKVPELLGLLKKSTEMRSASVTRLLHASAFGTWDMSSVVYQLQQGLSCTPDHLQADVYYRNTSGHYEKIEDLTSWQRHEGQTVGDRCYRIVTRLQNEGEIKQPHRTHSAPATSEPKELSAELIHSDSVQSDLSEIDLATSRLSLSRMSTNSSDVLGNSATSFSTTHHHLKEFTESELMLYQPKTGKPLSTNPRDESVSRSFFCCLDISSKDGISFYGYNASYAFLEVLLVHFSRVLTWSQLRENLSRSLALVKTGARAAAPSGAKVVHPRHLYVSGGGNTISKGAFPLPKDAAVAFVPFWQVAADIIEAHSHLPNALKQHQLRLIDGSAFGKYLREAHVIASDADDSRRSRSRSNASLQGISTNESGLKEPSSVSSETQASSGEVRSSKSRGDRPLASPTKTSGSSQTKLRSNAGASNALLAARARARGGLPPGKFGGPPTSRPPTSSTCSDGVAPWDLPIANPKGPKLASAPTSATDVPPTSATSTHSTSSTTNEKDGDKGAAVRSGGNVSLHDLSSKPPTSSSVRRPASRSNRRYASSSYNGLEASSTWKTHLERAWGPRSALVVKQSTVDSRDKRQGSVLRSMLSNAQLVGRDPLKSLYDGLQSRWHAYESQSTSHSICLYLFQRLSSCNTQGADEPVSRDIIQTLLKSGHVVLHRRFRVVFVERFEVAPTEESEAAAIRRGEQNEEIMTRLQAAMDLVNLVTYKRTFVLSPKDGYVARLHSQHTIWSMSQSQLEGEELQTLKQQTMRNSFRRRMELAHEFFHDYARHLRRLGFQHLRTLQRDGQDASEAGLIDVNSTIDIPAPSSTASSTLSDVGAIANDSQAFTEYFYFAGVPGRSGTNTRRQSSHRRTASLGNGHETPVLLLEVTCDHHGVGLEGVLVTKRDLEQHANGYQARLSSNTQSSLIGKDHPLTGDLVAVASAWLRAHLQASAWVYGFCVRSFQRSLTTWATDDHNERKLPAASPSRFKSESGSYQNLVKGLQYFLELFPTPPSVNVSAGQKPQRRASLPQDCSIRSAEIVLEPILLQSSEEKIPLHHLLRYVACHAGRYEVMDLLQFGSPDAVVCQSTSGSFYNRQSIYGSSPTRSLPRSGVGYSLVITTQNQTVVDQLQLLLLRCAPLSLNSAQTGVIPMERAIQEARSFVTELFRAAAEHYERDLLWSRLLYDDVEGTGVRVAESLGLKPSQFSVHIGQQQLEQCLKLSECSSLAAIDPMLGEMLTLEDVSWDELAMQLRDLYSDQLREYQFGDELSNGKIIIEVCRREEPLDQKFTPAQRRVISDFVNSIVHWQWRSLLYD